MITSAEAPQRLISSAPHAWLIGVKRYQTSTIKLLWLNYYVDLIISRQNSLF